MYISYQKLLYCDICLAIDTLKLKNNQLPSDNTKKKRSLRVLKDGGVAMLLVTCFKAIFVLYSHGLNSIYINIDKLKTKERTFDMLIPLTN